MSGSSRPVLSPGNIGLFIGFEQCPRYLQQSLDKIAGNEDELGVFLSEIGNRFEKDITEDIEQDAVGLYDGSEWDVSDEPEIGRREVREELADLVDNATVTSPVVIEQPPARGYIDVWGIKGRGDMLAFWESPDGGVIAHIFEIKASSDVQPYHQIQAGIYALIFEDILESVVEELEIRISVVHRESDSLDFSDPDSIHTIAEPEVVREDVRRLLREGGTVDSVYKQDEVNYALTGKCNTCLYNEECFKHALDNLDLALLGLTEGEQRILKKYGIEDIEDLAGLKQKIDDPKPYVYDELPSRDEATVKQLLSEPTIGGKVDRMVQRAQSMLAGVQTNDAAKQDSQARTGPFYATPIQGSGDSTLPSTSASPNAREKMDYDPDELIRVYLYVREDFMRDSLAMLAGRVVRNSSVIESLPFSSVVDELPDNDDREEVLEVEGELLEDFFSKLFRAIEHVAEGDTQSALHVYFFSRMERDALVDGILRQMPRYDEDSFDAVRDILGYRKAIDQPMVSIVQDELQDRFALRYPGSGILPILDQAVNQYCDCGCDTIFKKSDWEVTRSGGGLSFNCYDTFKYNLFNFKLPVEADRDGRLHSASNIQNPDHFYPLRARFDNQVPLEYIWASKGKLDLSWADSPRDKWEIQKYRYHDADEQEERITPEDIGLLGEKMCHALHHVESCTAKWQNPFLGKEQINLPELPEFDLGDIDLARSLNDYLDLEHYADRQEKYREYAKAPRERVQKGHSAIVEVENTKLDDDDLVVKGRLVYEPDEFSDPSKVAYACRLKGAENESSGSHRVANPVTWDDSQGVHKDDKKKPKNIESGLPVEVQSVNTGDRTIEFRCSDFNTDGNFIPNTNPETFEYVHRHDVWVQSEAEAGYGYGVRRVHIQPGDRYILDRQTDDWTSTHAHDVLETLQSNRPSQNPRYHYYHLLDGLIRGENV
jgi:hypothetical protein